MPRGLRAFLDACPSRLDGWIRAIGCEDSRDASREQGRLEDLLERPQASWPRRMPDLMEGPSCHRGCAREAEAAEAGALELADIGNRGAGGERRRRAAGSATQAALRGNRPPAGGGRPAVTAVRLWKADGAVSRFNTLRDQAIADDIRDTLAHDDRLGGLGLDIEVRGEVAHVSGAVRSEAERRLLRRVVRRVGGVRAVWDLLRLPGEPPLRVIDLGCGGAKQHPSALGVDRHRRPGVDVCADLERGLPFRDETIDHAFAVHVLEHVAGLLGLMNEIHRVLKPTGILHAMVPAAGSTNALADPTHVRVFHLQTFKYFCTTRPAVRRFRPLAAAATADNIFADLQPLKGEGASVTEREIARLFD